MSNVKWKLAVVSAILTTVVQAGLDIPPAFKEPPSDEVDAVNPLIGNGGDSPNGSGGMIPSTAPPFAMTRWTAQTDENYVSVTPYNHTHTSVHGFQGTHQPAIWMGESGQVVVSPGLGTIKQLFEDRGMDIVYDGGERMEAVSGNYYAVLTQASEADGGGVLKTEMSASSRVGHVRFTFPVNASSPYIFLEATRPTILGSPASPNGTWIIYPSGLVTVDPSNQEICGRNPERQDEIIGPNAAPSFAGYFCARFNAPFSSYGVAENGSTTDGATSGEGPVLGAYARFEATGEGEGPTVVDVRVGVSFISVDQARRNLEAEIPDGTSLEETAQATRTLWVEKLGRVKVEGASADERATFYTGIFHTLQYPYEQDEDGMYYSGYDDSVHEGNSYTGYSNWDTYRAEWAWLILLAPERIPGMVQSMLQDYVEGGWLPMWKNIVETNIMVATHADSLVAEAHVKNITGFDLETAYAAVYKDAMVPPVDDWTISYYDREEGVGYEVRAGLSSVYEEKGWVANDIHSESASRTLDYAYDDWAIATFAELLGYSENASFFRARSQTAPFTIFNADTGFMEARDENGSWAGQDQGWTEGDMWAYTFDVIQDVPGLIERRGGNASFVAFLDEHFDGGHNDQTNEPSHHIPYLYALAGAASKAQSRIREVAAANYNSTVDGLSGNEDCGQMSAWYIFSALGFYPVDPVSATYVVGTPFYDRVTISFPNASQPLVISAPGAPTQPYIKSLTVNDETISQPILTHQQIANGGKIMFEMSDTPQDWASATLVTEGNAGSVEAARHDEL